MSISELISKPIDNIFVGITVGLDEDESEPIAYNSDKGLLFLKSGSTYYCLAGNEDGNEIIFEEYDELPKKNTHFSSTQFASRYITIYEQVFYPNSQDSLDALVTGLNVYRKQDKRTSVVEIVFNHSYTLTMQCDELFGMRYLCNSFEFLEKELQEEELVKEEVLN